MPDRKRFINVRGGYSDTSGIAPCNTEMQLYQFDKRTRMMISNKTFDILKNVFQNPEKMFMMREADSAFCEDVISNVFIEPVRLLPGESFNWSAVFKAKFDPVFFDADYNEVLDLLWYVCKWIHDRMVNKKINNVIYSAFNEEMKGTRVFPNDVLLNITGGSIGRCCIFPETLETANVNQHVSIIRVNKNVFLPEFMHYYWISPLGSMAISLYQTGGNREGMSAEAIKNTPIILMPLVEQKLICKVLDAKCAEIDAVLNKTRTSIEEYKKLKHSTIYGRKNDGNDRKTL